MFVKLSIKQNVPGINFKNCANSKPIVIKTTNITNIFRIVFVVVIFIKIKNEIVHSPLGKEKIKNSGNFICFVISLKNLIYFIILIYSNHLNINNFSVLKPIYIIPPINKGVQQQNHFFLLNTIFSKFLYKLITYLIFYRIFFNKLLTNIYIYIHFILNNWPIAFHFY